jgi:AcrR family transcriptional regulator
MSGTRCGRRPGESGAREAILASARAAFAELGYDRASIRGIAADAAVDPALVIHYFGSKDVLFGAALEIPVEPAAVLERAAAADPAQLGATVARAFLEAWEPPDNRQRLVAMMRSAMTNEAALAMVREYLGRRVFGPITQALGTPDAELRANLVGSQFIGLAMMRYITRVEPIASAPVEQLVAAVGPTVQRYLTGDLGPN